MQHQSYRNHPIGLIEDYAGGLARILLTGFLLMILLSALFFLMGYKLGRQVEQKQAVEAGVAVYRVHPSTGIVEFVYTANPK